MKGLTRTEDEEEMVRAAYQFMPDSYIPSLFDELVRGTLPTQKSRGSAALRFWYFRTQLQCPPGYHRSVHR